MQAAVRAAVLQQREDAVAEENISQKAMEEAGCEIVELTPAEREQFVNQVKPLHDEARARFGNEMFDLLKKA